MEERVENMRDGRRTYSKTEYDYMKRQRAFAWARFDEAKQEQADASDSAASHPHLRQSTLSSRWTRQRDHDHGLYIGLKERLE